jgi:hypothetical protein
MFLHSPEAVDVVVVEVVDMDDVVVVIRLAVEEKIIPGRNIAPSRPGEKRIVNKVVRAGVRTVSPS